MSEEKEYPKTDFAVVEDIRDVNFRPHPYVIGSRHLSRNDSIYLGPRQIRAMEQKHGPMCAYRGCNLYYDAHESDRVACVKLRRDCTNQEMKEWLKSLIDTGWCAQEKVDGFAFLETPEHYRVQP
jgi:hypothetical protein